MFESLDDPAPPPLTDDRRAVIVATSRARRRRHRAMSLSAAIVAGIAVVALVGAARTGSEQTGSIEAATASTQPTHEATSRPSDPPSLTPETVLGRLIPEIERLGFPVAQDAIPAAARAQELQRRQMREYILESRPDVSIDPNQEDDLRWLSIPAGARLSDVHGRNVPADMVVHSMNIMVMTPGNPSVDWKTIVPMPAQLPGSEQVATFEPACSLWERDHRTSTDLTFAVGCPQGVLTVSLAGPGAMHTVTRDEVERLARIGFGLADPGDTAPSS